MDKTDLMNYYKHPCLIFNGPPASIEDDEILDLDSISLDSNEDTWLWSNSKRDNYKEISQEEMKQRLDNATLDSSGDFSRISLSNWDSLKEQTLPESFLNTKTTPYRKKLEFNRVENTSPINRIGDNSVNAAIENGSEKLRKQDLFSNERDAFKKPLSKKDISEKNSILYSIENKLFAMGDTDAVDHKNPLNYDIKNTEHDNWRKLDEEIGQEKNYVELNGTEKRKSLINELSPICHSTPMPMLSKRRMNKIENENRSLLKLRDQEEGNGDSPFVNSSTFEKKEVHYVVDAPSETKLTEAVLELSIKDNANSNEFNATFEVDDNLSTSSSDSRRSSSSGNHLPRAVLPSRTLTRPNSSNPRFNAGINRNIRSPSRPSSAIKTPFTETRMKQPTKRTPSLSRLPAPSLNIDEEFVSVVEIKSKDTASKTSDRKSANGPVSHIPRPSTRIPVFRTSNSCTRSTFKK